MVSKAVCLFLFGVSVAYGKFLPRLSPAPYEVAVMPDILKNGCPSALELAPLICKFMLPNIPYKPQLIKPLTYVPPLVVENCDTPHLQLELELPSPIVEKKPVVIPEPPSLPPITLPKFPVPVMIEKPILPPVPIVEPCEPALIPETPVVNIPVAPPLPAIVESEPCLDDVVEPIVIPQPPELPAFVMPELPVPVAEPPVFVAPCPEDEPIPVVPIPEHIQPLAPVPAPPQLPPVRLPELPVHIEIPRQPIVSAPMVVEDPCITEEIVVPQPAPVFLPQPPRLPEPVHIAFEKPIPMPVFADPCEPALHPVVKMGELPPYFVKHSPYHFRSMERVPILSRYDY